IAPEGLADFDVVAIGAGGGGGKGNASGGGGAGGLVTGYVSTTAEFGLPDGTTFNVKVGQGGPGAAIVTETGQNGQNSSFTGTVDGTAVSVIALGGGGGGSFGSTNAANGSSGASGGGGGFYRPSNFNGQAGASNGGTTGANSIWADTGGPQGGAAAGGGGGGAAGPGQVGKAAGNGQGDGGVGGLGIAYDLFGTIINYGGGGGGVGYNFNGTVKDNFTNGGRAPNGSFLGGSGNVDGPGGDAVGIASGGGAGTTGGGQGGKGRVFIIYSNIRILPVEFLYVQADYNSHSREIILNWATAKEWENSHFEIERSVTGVKDFKKVGEVEGMGWTDQITEYEFVDRQLPLGAKNLLYRLKQVDFNGNFEYSEVVSVRIPGVEFTQGVWRAYPNPTNGSKLRISLMDRSQYEAERLSFRIIHPMFVTPSKTVDTEDEMNQLLEQLALKVPKGIFVVEIQWGQKVEHIKVLKQLQ
ncbi:MAG: hypothetical protein EA341_06730, partial [Mongoliibacter sp.]|uniref:glycine-rich domain-containing protein n=1 Tax=Mongoliibacter sp. TaxID=2022438 RepID=UPI0012F0DB97